MKGVAEQHYSNLTLAMPRSSGGRERNGESAIARSEEIDEGVKAKGKENEIFDF